MSVQQAGTLSGNPLAMTAGLKTLEILGRPGQYEYLDKVTKRLIEGILQAGRDAGHAVEGGSISGAFFHTTVSHEHCFCRNPLRGKHQSNRTKFARENISQVCLSV